MVSCVCSVLPLGEGLSGIVATTGERLFVADARDDLRNPFRDHDRARGMVTYLGLPIRTGGETIGVLTFNTTEPRRYAGEELEYLTAFADQAAVAIRNAQQVATLARSEEHYRAIVEGSVQGILIHTAGTIRFVNQALVRLMRLPGPEPLLGTSVFDFLAPTDRPRIEAYGQARVRGEPAPMCGWTACCRPSPGRARRRTSSPWWTSASARALKSSCASWRFTTR